ncbi:FG-GAP repeat domain-containing protein [Mucilaginibacter antarcticus]|uniref:FG-GAP repeat domain-containing protein n=1 Tax=Mucilaginibacter antarcticus TaxID=1855725 RepID=UPI0036337E13
MNLDNIPDYLVGQFGKMTGRLSWFEQQGSNIKEHILRDKPGCVKAIVDNKNTSRAPNIWALFAQGDEGLFKYINDGKGNFTEKRVISFPPSYGSTYFDLVDFNGDGLQDIIYTCGDNGDYSQIPKPYHGIYIYLNTGDEKFVNKYFYPMDGCYKAIVRDFDKDGKLDIAAISQFPGGTDRKEAFIYLKGRGALDFQAFTLPTNTPLTNAMTIDAGDIDGDGKTDLLVGNGFVDPVKGNKQPLFIVLKNIN